MFDPERPIIVEIDALDYAIKGYIQQLEQNEKIHSVTFYLRKMSLAELNYDIHDKELLAVVAVFQEWRVYLKRFKYQVKILTDHKNLTYFITTKILNRR